MPLWSDLGRRAALGGASGRAADDVARLNDCPLVPPQRDGPLHRHRTGWSSTAARRGACATSARVPSSCSSRPATPSPLRDVHPDRLRAPVPPQRATGRSGSCSTGTGRCGPPTATPTSSSGRSRRSATTSRRPNDLSILDDARGVYRCPDDGRHDRHRDDRRPRRTADRARSSATASRAPRCRSSPAATGRTRSSRPTRRCAQRMVSAWTVELAFQTLGRLPHGLRARREAGDGRTARRDSATGSGRTSTATSSPTASLPASPTSSRMAIEYLLHPRDRRTGRQLPPAADDPRDDQRPVHPRAGDAARRPHRAPPLVPRRRPPDGPARWTTAAGPRALFQRAEIRGQLRREIGPRSTSTPTSATSRRWPGSGRADAAFDGAARDLPDPARSRLSRRPLPRQSERVLQQLRRRLHWIATRPAASSAGSGPAGSASRAAGGSTRAGPASSSTS